MVCNAVKRLITEHRNLVKEPLDNIAACPKSDENFLEWEVVLIGPSGSFYENGFFIADLSFPITYPMDPPKMKFITKIMHPNIYNNGNVCISILHVAGDDPFGYEDRLERWSPVISVEKILVCILNMLCEPNFDSPADVDAAKLYRENQEEFKKQTKKCVSDSLIYQI